MLALSSWGSGGCLFRPPSLGFGPACVPSFVWAPLGAPRRNFRYVRLPLAAPRRNLGYVEVLLGAARRNFYYVGVALLLPAAAVLRLGALRPPVARRLLVWGLTLVAINGLRRAFLTCFSDP